MKKIAVILCFFMGLILLPALSAFSAETLTIITYYPSPEGVYKTLQADTMILNPIDPLDAKQPPLNGYMISDITDGGRVKMWDATANAGAGAWVAYVTFASELLGERTLAADYYATNSYTNVGGNPMKITEVTPSKGLYSITWEGTMETSNTNANDKSVYIKIMYNAVPIQVIEYPLPGNDPSTVNDISGGTIILLNRNVNYNIRAQIKRTHANVTAKVDSGFKIRAELMLPF